MHRFQDLLYKIRLKRASGNPQVEITGITADSRAVQPGYLFVATKGTQVDGHKYIEKAISAGASAIIVEDETYMPEGEQIACALVYDSAEALGLTAANFHGNPTEKLSIVAVTGTNGKTTCSTLLYELFTSLGYRCGLLSTVENRIDGKVIPSTHTTPDAVQLQALLAKMVEQGCTHCFMEASSHAIHQKRIAGVRFAGAFFTNLTHDHLDYHGTFENYREAKKALFDLLEPSAFALTNADDKNGLFMLRDSMAQCFSYSIQGKGKFNGRLLSNTFQGLEMEFEGKQAWMKFTGAFNAQNLMAVYSAAVLLGEDRERVIEALSALSPAAGRFTTITTPNKVTVIVDYAHTPDAVKNVLETITSIRTNNEQLITLLGCGGDRDKTKRPVMAATALEFSNVAIFTSDNPRSEDPEAILADMKQGVSPSNYRKTKWVVDRAEAIKLAAELAMPGDIVLIAGKGHETYQEIKGYKFDFDDKEHVKQAWKLD